MSEEFDLSRAIAEVQQMLSTEEGENKIQGLLGMLSGGGNEENGDIATPATDNSHHDILSGLGDVEMLMKLQSVMSMMGNQKNDSNAAFLQSLRPFLKEDRRQKLDRAAKILSVTKAIKAFKDMGLGGI